MLGCPRMPVLFVEGDHGGAEELGMVAVGHYEMALACFEENFQSCVLGSG